MTVPLLRLARTPAEEVTGPKLELVFTGRSAWTNPELALRIVAVPLIWISPEEALTMGMLKVGALDHGFVPAVAVTVCTEDMITVPLLRLHSRPAEEVTGP